MSNPNSNSLTYTITAPSLSTPLNNSIMNVSGLITVDLSTPVLLNTPTKSVNVNNLDGDVTITNAYPNNSKFTIIQGSPIIDKNQPYQVITLYDSNGNIVTNTPNNYSSVTKILANYSSANSSSGFSIIYVIIIILVLAIIGGGIYFFMSKKNTNITEKGGYYYLK